MAGFDGFASWDETYVHQMHNQENRTVLSYRDEEPWTWVRAQGDGRVFYTAWGHDERTWQNPGFHELLERGIRWAAGQDVQEELAGRTIENPFTYVVRSEEHTSELQSRGHLVCRLLLEKKK